MTGRPPNAGSDDVLLVTAAGSSGQAYKFKYKLQTWHGKPVRMIQVSTAEHIHGRTGRKTA